MLNILTRFARKLYGKVLYAKVLRPTQAFVRRLLFRRGERVPRSVVPLSRVFGLDRGPQSIARYYIDQFMEGHASDVRGSVLEIGASTYTARLGGARVTRSDVLSVTPGNPAANIVADLTRGDELAAESYDCVILTQTLQFIYDFRSALRHAERILKNNGVILASLSGISQISRYDMNRWGEYWRFTPLAARLVFEECCHHCEIEVEEYGNVLAAIGLLQGIASCEVEAHKLDFHDQDYPVVLGVRVLKTGASDITL